MNSYCGATGRRNKRPDERTDSDRNRSTRGRPAGPTFPYYDDPTAAAGSRFPETLLRGTCTCRQTVTNVCITHGGLARETGVISERAVLASGPEEKGRARKSGQLDVSSPSRTK